MAETGTIRKLVNKPAAEIGGKPSAFGFIRMGGGEDRFFLPSTMLPGQHVRWEDLQVGDAVEFRSVEHPKGMRAMDVVRV